VIQESILAGLAGGTLGALLGLGGGFIMVPILTLLMGLPLTTAVPASLVAIISTAVGGSAMFIREGHTDRPLAVRAAGVSMAAALVGARLALSIPASVLEVAFALLLSVVVVKMISPQTEDSSAAHTTSPWLAGGLFAGAGLVAGMLGVGGGVLNVPALHLVLRRPLRVAVATSTLMITFTAAAGAAAYAAVGHVDWRLAAGCATGAFVGGRIGAFLSPRAPLRLVRMIFVVVLIYVALKMFVRGFNLPWWP
jgi:uncharacterized membrane protein YfcA